VKQQQRLNSLEKNEMKAMFHRIGRPGKIFYVKDESGKRSQGPEGKNYTKCEVSWVIPD
jgi:hypothetical protein